jgi:hypothetical protein
MRAGSSASRQIGSAICLAGTLDLSCVIGTIRVNCNAKHLCRSHVWRAVMLSNCACVELLLWWKDCRPFVRHCSPKSGAYSRCRTNGMGARWVWQKLRK